MERNIGECAGSGGLSHSPAERLGELEFDSQAESSNGSRTASEGLIYKDKDEAANRDGLPTLRALFFFKATLKSAVAIPAAPKLHRESQPPLCEPGLMGLTSRQALLSF